MPAYIRREFLTAAQPAELLGLPTDRLKIREVFFRRSGLPSDPKQVSEYLARRLGEAYKRFLKTAPSNTYAEVDKDGWRL
jgi:hypothetical protein